MMKQLRTFLVLGFACTLLFISCKDNTTGTIEDEDEDDQIDLSEPLERLPGDDSKDIINATFDFTYPSEIKDEFVTTQEVDGYDQRILRTEIEVTFQESTTVRQINELLDTYNAKIVDMLEGINSVILLIPDPGDLEKLGAVIEQIESEAFVKFIVESSLVSDSNTVEASEEALKIPEHISVNSRLDHHLAIRAHAAWNLKNMVVELDRRPWFVVADGFGGGVPGSGYDANFTDSDFGPLSTSFHGYHVLGIALGNHNEINELNSEQNDVVGIFPEKLNVRTYDLKNVTNIVFNFSWSRKMNSIIRLMRDIRSANPNAKIVLNTSLDSRDDIQNNEQHAYNWIGKVRGVTQQENLENAFVHFTGAGNLRKNEARYPAKEASMFARAGLEDVMINESSRKKLKNIFVVENFRWTLQDVDIRPLPNCPSSLSIMEGNLSAIGTDVYSFGECVQRNSDGKCVNQEGDSKTSFASGTSMSSPQAAGLGAYVWSVNPNLSVSEVMEIIRSTAESITAPIRPGVFCNDIESQPVIDAYAAVLAAGGDRARSALLDVNEDGVFDEKDIEIYLREFDERSGALDYSRFDLNGTGKTGGNSTDRFDLNHELTYGTVTQYIGGENVEFDESTLTDQEILCYYAYSDSFEGSGELRKELLNGVCTINKLPSVSTSSISLITENSAQSGGEVTSDGGSNVTARGVCWSTSQNPTTSDDCTVDGIGTGSFTSNITGLDPVTNYLVRAYATNEIGTAYGNQKSFTTTDNEGSMGNWLRIADFGGSGRAGTVGFSIDGKGYIGLGLGSGGQVHSDFWEYNPANGSWSKKADLPQGSGLATGFSIGKKGYILAGSKFWEYDPEENKWNEKSSMESINRMFAVGFQ